MFGGQQPNLKSAFTLAAALMGAVPIAALPAASAAPLSLSVRPQPKMPVFILRDGDRDGRREAVLMDDWLYHSPTNGRETDGRVTNGRVYLVPAGYTTDFASIPWFGRWFVDQFGKHAEAAVFHDWLYAVGNPDPKVKKIERKDADERMRVAMREQNVAPLREWVVYWAVRVGGDRSYGSPSEFENNWTTPEPYSAGEEMKPPIEKPAVPYIAKGVSAEEFNDVTYQHKLRFRYGTMPDKCTDLRKRTIDLGEEKVADLLYEKCMNTHPYNTFLDGVTDASQCTNMANYACESERWRNQDRPHP